MKNIYVRILEGINDGIAQALTRKKDAEITIGQNRGISAPKDTDTYEKHTKEWFRLSEFISKGYPLRNPKTAWWAMTDDDKAYLHSLFDRKDRWADDERELIRKNRMGRFIDLCGDLYIRMDAVIRKLVTIGETFEDEDVDFMLTEIAGIKNRRHPLYGFCPVGEDGIVGDYVAYGEPVPLYKLIQATERPRLRSNYVQIPHFRWLNLNWLDVSKVRNFCQMFYMQKFNGDISLWDTHSATDMSNMFTGADFDGDISGWDISCVRNMHGMFNGSKFSHDISNWVIDKDCVTTEMFLRCRTMPRDFRPRKKK